ncbi:uncharacterized protein C8Q71DRAFT_721216 [Rhodofomes roseus]|uniref:Uncharacterized protein n=1 Tax=Rhodofomes roseus TaxID=34475 RepID=A0ABQ8KQB3_9APHY|nr:uncharacterized protein C8Q71DRAFT_721216 [Rhodofomes roseus]KAH9840720.1 hypothetical protein C8Q71DRAFT_721216 [Rhodofomes roseus]
MATSSMRQQTACRTLAALGPLVLTAQQSSPMAKTYGIIVRRLHSGPQNGRGANINWMEWARDHGNTNVYGKAVVDAYFSAKTNEEIKAANEMALPEGYNNAIRALGQQVYALAKHCVVEGYKAKGVRLPAMYMAYLSKKAQNTDAKTAGEPSSSTSKLEETQDLTEGAAVSCDPATSEDKSYLTDKEFDLVKTHLADYKACGAQSNSLTEDNMIALGNLVGWYVRVVPNVGNGEEPLWHVVDMHGSVRGIVPTLPAELPSIEYFGNLFIQPFNFVTIPL